MLIINADDFGKNRLSTDRILACYARGRIDSASAMVFMSDSERASRLAIERNLETGLHLNFSLLFDGNVRNGDILESLGKTSKFLGKSRYHMLIYNPFLKKDFQRLIKTQYNEYLRLFGRIPRHMDGHKHFHLCMNVMTAKMIPERIRVRRNFTFEAEEKPSLNRAYRRLIDAWLRRRYACSEFFFDICPSNFSRVKKITQLSRRHNVELMVHPERTDEYAYLMGEEFRKILCEVTEN